MRKRFLTAFFCFMSIVASAEFTMPFWSQIKSTPTNASYSFLGLFDIPSLAGQASKFLQLNVGEDGIQWSSGAVASGGMNIDMSNADVASCREVLELGSIASADANAYPTIYGDGVSAVLFATALNCPLLDAHNTHTTGNNYFAGKVSIGTTTILSQGGPVLVTQGSIHQKEDFPNYMEGGLSVHTISPQTGYDLTVASGVYAGGTISGDNIVDRSSSPDTLADAYEIVNSHVPINGKVDHSRLSPKVWGTKFTVRETGHYITRIVWNAELIPENERVPARRGERPVTVRSVPRIVTEPETFMEAEPDRASRNLSCVVSAQAIVIQDLQRRLRILEQKK